MNDLQLLCEEFGFTSLLTQVSDFISTHSVAEEEARKSISGISEENLQIRVVVSRLREGLSGLRTANLPPGGESSLHQEIEQETQDKDCGHAGCEFASFRRKPDPREQLAAARGARTKMEKAHGQEIAGVWEMATVLRK
jgi:hypothetical protein